MKIPLLRRVAHWKMIAALLMVYDIVAVNLAFGLALWLRFDFDFTSISPIYYSNYLKFAPIYTVVSILIFWRSRLYNSVWRFASFNEMMRVILATAATSIFYVAGMYLFFCRGGIRPMPLSCYFVGTALQFLMVLGIRFSYRFMLLQKGRIRNSAKTARRVMLVGAGNAGQMILRDARLMREQELNICCVIDDNPNKWGRYMDGVPVVGGRDEILLNVEKYKIETIFVAIPSASAADKRDILNICKETGCELKNLPGMYQFVEGSVRVSSMQDVAVEDLLGRPPIRVDMNEIFRQISDKTVLITGGGGSIGSELCRQVAACAPKLLVIFDIYENNAYDIEQELRSKYPNLNMAVLVGSVRDSRRLDHVFQMYRPDIVYHAAAHKHVPLMETSPCEAIKNNVIGTYKTAYAALKYGCSRFVLISTDKAVNPTNIMGASKRLCEMVVQSFDAAVRTGSAGKLPVLFTHNPDNVSELQALEKDAKLCTEFVAVRFGNVLGSNGSVIPLFKKQIAHGGPVTVTHPDIIRYFMTIPEAVSLVMQAGTYASGGEIFVLDMGMPVRIDDLARNLIKLSGLKPDEDIQVVYTGLRPGEKLYEEKLMAEEGLKKTRNDLIHVGTPIAIDLDVFLPELKELMDAAYGNRPDIEKLVVQMVPTFHPDHIGRKDATYEKLVRQAAEVN